MVYLTQCNDDIPVPNYPQRIFQASLTGWFLMIGVDDQKTKDGIYDVQRRYDVERALDATELEQDTAQRKSS